MEKTPRRARKFVENAYYHELARELRTFGYGISNRERGDFQIQRVPDELCERFSKRHAQIDQALARLLDEKPELAGGDVMAIRRLLATAERARKQKDLSQDELRTVWDAQLTKAERASLHQLEIGPERFVRNQTGIGVGEAVQWAEEHLFERSSVVLECQVVCETDRLSISLPLPHHREFADFREPLLSANFDPRDLGSRVTPRMVEKFDEFLPDDLLTRACAAERLALREALACINAAR